MKGLSTQKRYEDICKISGLSEDIVKRVLNAEKESILNSLKKGERATLIGRCTIRPELRTKIEIGNKQVSFIKLKAEVSSALQDEIGKMDGFVKEELNNDNVDILKGIRTLQINALI